MLLRIFYAVIVIVALIVGVHIWTVHSAMKDLRTTVWGEALGPEDAEKVIVEIMDYRCRHCRTAQPAVDRVLDRHDDVKIVIRHLPVFQEPSIREARLALAAARQGKFAETHKALLAREKPLTDKEFSTFAKQLGLDIEKLRKDAGSRETSQQLLQTIDATEILNIGSTPTFIVGDIVYKGIPSSETFDTLLSRAYKE